MALRKAIRARRRRLIGKHHLEAFRAGGQTGNPADDDAGLLHEHGGVLQLALDASKFRIAKDLKP